MDSQVGNKLNQQPNSQPKQPGGISKGMFKDWIQPPESDKEGLVAMNLIESINVKEKQDFQQEFVYGYDTEIWRSGEFKKVTIYLDRNDESLLWISTKSKAFLFDLSYTTLHLYDFEVEKETKIPEYIVLKQFDEEAAIVFRQNQATERTKIAEKLGSYIRWVKINYTHPPMFSVIMRLAAMEQVRTGTKLTNAKAILEIFEKIESQSKRSRSENQKILSLLYKEKHGKDMDRKSLFDREQLNKFCQINYCQSQLAPLYRKYSRDVLKNELCYLKPYLSREEFGNFLRAEQNESPETIKRISEQTKEGLSFYDFCSYLESQLINYAALAHKVDESLPLRDYYCWSSHNTYLSGNQLTSSSKIERFIEDLNYGIKCVELDVHNDGHKPIITHAISDKSLCAPIDFEETIQEIDRFSDSHPSHYPIVLSVENHASENNRESMINILLKYFSKSLLIVNPEDKPYPLSYLFGKMIIKTDSNLEELKCSAHKKQERLSQLSNFHLPHHFEKKPQFLNQKLKERHNKFEQTVKQHQMRKINFEVEFPKHLFLPVRAMTKVTGMFKSPTGIKNEHSTGFQVCSMTNTKVQKAVESEIINYTKRSFLRTYPVGTEINSNNYDPAPMLKVGAQIIALNTQTKDKYALLMTSYFTAGRPNCIEKLGFIDKPIHLRSNQPYVPTKKLYEISLFECHKNNIKVKFYGMEQDMKANESATNSFTVKHFNEGFLLFKIESQFKECIPLRFIRSGYRVLVAKNQNYEDTGVRVVIHIRIKE